MSTYFQRTNLIEGVNSTASSGGTLTLTASSKTMQRITGVLNHTVSLPDATTLKNPGRRFSIKNRSTGTVTVNDFNGGLIASLGANTQKDFVVTDVSTSSGTWVLAGDSATSGGGSASVQAADKLKMMQGLAQINFNDGSTIASKKVRYPVEDIGADAWVSKTSLNTARASGGSFELHGLAYVAGGYNAGYINTSERYDQDHNYWLVRASIPANREETPGSFELDGFGYLAGGYDGSAMNSSIQYNDSTNAWATKANINVARSRLAGFRIENEGIIAGGNTTAPTSLRITEAYDATADAWRSKGDIIVSSSGRAAHCAFVVNGKAFLANGYISGGTNQATAERYDPQSATFVSVASNANSLNARRAFAINGVAYVHGGQSAETAAVDEYVELANVWRVKSNMPTTRAYHHGMALNGRGYAVSGFVSGSPNATITEYRNSNFVFVGPILSTNTAITSLLVATIQKGVSDSAPIMIRSDGDNWQSLKSNSDSALKLNETLKSKFKYEPLMHALGGYNGSSTVATQETYNDSSNTWRNRTSYPNAIQSSGYFNLDGFGYNAGGYDGSSSVATTRRHNEITDAFTVRASLGAANNTMGGGTVGGYGWVWGGNIGSASAITQRYDSTLDSWSNKANMNTARYNHAGEHHNGHLYACGGTDSGSTKIATVERYNHIADVWTTRTSMSVVRNQFHTQSFKGYLYTLQGENGPVLNTTERYDDQNNSWANRASTTTRYNAPGAVLNNFMYVYGGVNAGYFNTSERYNDANDTYTSITGMNSARASHNAHGSGSYRKFELRVGTLALISTGQGFWVNIPSISVSTQQCGSIELNNSGYRIGGTSTLTSTDKWIPALQYWVAGPQMNSGQQSFQCGSLLGFGYTANLSSAGNERLDDTLNVWTTGIAADPVSVGGHAAVGVLNERMYAMGGATTNAVRYFNPKTNSWTSGLATLSSSRYYFVSFSSEGYMYVVGDQNSPYSTVERYNDAANTWATMTSTINGHSLPSRFVIAEQGHIVGGGSGAGNTANEKYLSGANVWLDRTFAGTSRWGGGGFSLDNGGYVFAGNPGGSGAERFVYPMNDIIAGVALEAK